MIPPDTKYVEVGDADVDYAVIQVADVRAAVEAMKARGVEFEEYDTPETRTENGIARTPDGGEGACFKDSEGNLLGVVCALGR
jgi:predicted enzyme related to lactoylglutathione lyase